jgi:hypothetical protein
MTVNDVGGEIVHGRNRRRKTRGVEIARARGAICQQPKLKVSGIIFCDPSLIDVADKPSPLPKRKILEGELSICWRKIV